MFKPRQRAIVFSMAGILLLALLATPARAVMVTVSGGQKVNLDKEQLQLLKKQPGIYYLKLPPEKSLANYTLVELPEELGGGYLIATPAQLAAGLEAIGALEKSKTQKIVRAGPGKGRWFVDLYFGGVMPADSDVDAKAKPYGVTITDSANNVDYDNTHTFGGRAGGWAPELSWIGMALDFSYFKMKAEGIDTKVFPLSLLLMLRYPGHRLQPYMGVGPGLFLSDAKIDMELSGQDKTFSDTAVDIGLDTRAGLAWRLFKSFAVFGEYRFTYFEGNYDDKVSSGGTKIEVKVDTKNYVHHFLIGVSYRF
ncbi:MAG: outer membrane beta-barrel protein [Deltaproteobacteria bacterium]|jgi:opacity protein-like surface antigen